MTPAAAGIALRPPETVMRLARMGAAFQTRLSFMRQLVRRMEREAWQFERLRADLDDEGHGTAVYAAHTGERTYSLVAFTRHIDPEQRTDRVIAEVWDATFSLFDGIPDDADIERLRQNTPKQESGRFRASELVLARANKSLRLFEHVVAALAEGNQPAPERIVEVGYLMRTTAVYGSGKFGCADRARIAGRQEFAAPFQAELLCVYLIRWFVVDLVNHVAARRGGSRAASLRPKLAAYLGIGNSTGLGMAPFLLKHPVLIHKWTLARETALARIRALHRDEGATATAFTALLSQAARYIGQWHVADARQAARIERLNRDLAELRTWCADGLQTDRPWDALYRHAEAQFSLEGQELCVSLLLEPHGTLIDDLCDTMADDRPHDLDPGMTVGDLRRAMERIYGDALHRDFEAPGAQQRFWYYSEDKLEPRLGDRFSEPGAEVEMPLAIYRDVGRLYRHLSGLPQESLVADYLFHNPEFRHIVRRVQTVADHPYGEIRDNLVSAETRPLDLLRFKLACFGVSRFDPKSDLWTRVCMFQGAPLPDTLAGTGDLNWTYPLAPIAAGETPVP